MKTYLLFIGCICIALSGRCQDKLTIPDTRDVVTVPTTYSRNFMVNFKRSTIMDLPAINGYSTVIGFRGWKDDSGGKSQEMAFTNADIYVRSGLNAGWGNWRKLLAENESGNVGIGTTNPQAKLAVEGNILAKEIKVKTDITVPDYVFEADYKLLPLTEIEAYVKEHKHLPEIPSAKEVREEGLDLAKMNLLLLKKVEELTLMLIEKEKNEEKQNKRIEHLENRFGR